MDLEFTKKYRHPAVKWYIQQHKYLMDGGKKDEFHLLPPGITTNDKIDNLKKTYRKEVEISEKKADDMIDKIINKVDGVGAGILQWKRNLKTSGWKDKAKNKFKKKDKSGVSTEARSGSLIGSIAEEVSLAVDPALPDEEL